MGGNGDRLVRRIQRWLHSVGPASRSGCPSLSDIAELDARVHRLRAAGDRPIRVRISSDVAGGAVANVPNRGGGECVAKEV